MRRAAQTALALLLLPACAWVTLTRPPAEPPTPQVDLHQLNADTCARCAAGISAPHHYTEVLT